MSNCGGSWLIEKAPRPGGKKAFRVGKSEEEASSSQAKLKEKGRIVGGAQIQTTNNKT